MASNLIQETGHPDIFSWFPSVPIVKSKDDKLDVAYDLTGRTGRLSPVKRNFPWTKGEKDSVQVQAQAFENNINSSHQQL